MYVSYNSIYILLYEVIFCSFKGINNALLSKVYWHYDKIYFLFAGIHKIQNSFTFFS